MNHRPLSPDEQQALAGNLLEYRRAKPTQQRKLVAYAHDILRRNLLALRSCTLRNQYSLGLNNRPAYRYGLDYLYWCRVYRAFLLATKPL